MALRCATARSVVLYLQMGRSLTPAAREAMIDLRHLPVPFPPRMSLVAVDGRGRHLAMTTEAVRPMRYVYQTGRMVAPAVRPRIVVPLSPPRRRR